MTREVIGELRCELGEGAVWDAALGRLFYVDIAGHRVVSLDPRNGGRIVYDVGEVVGTVVVTNNEKLVVALRSRIAALDPATGALSTLAEIEADRSDTRCNDGKCDPAGRFWVGTMVEGPARGTAALYCLDTDLSLTPRYRGVTISNGLVWTRDARRFYYIDTPRQRVQEFSFELETGTLADERVAIEIPRSLGAPDGMAIDDEDQLWIALWGGGGVIRVDPAAGVVREKVDLPVTNVTSCAFGGPRLDELYVTTARAGLAPEKLAAQPLAGALFRVPVRARGVAAPRFARDV